MKRLLLACCLMCGVLQANDWFHGWVDAGGVYGNRRIDIQETQLNPNQFQRTYIQLNSGGVEGEIGFIFPVPFYADFEGGYRELFNSYFTNFGSEGGIPGNIHLNGYEWSYRVDIGYVFTPLKKWSVYPFASYNYEQIQVSFNHFPLDLTPPVVVNDIDFRTELLFNGPSVGFGTNYTFSCPLFIWFEFDWQWRQILNRSNQFISIEEPLVQLNTSTTIQRESGWLNGPRFRLGLDYFIFKGLFVGVEGVYSQLFLSKKGFEHQKSVNTNQDLATHVITQQIQFQDTDLNRFDSKEFLVKINVGFVW